MKRTPEPELMDDLEQAAAYAAADFEVAHQRIVDVFLDRYGSQLESTANARVLDLGCGPADISVRLARALPTASFVGVDGAPAMLVEGHRRLEREALADRIELRELLLPSQDLEADDWSAVVSNSLLHHLADPQVLWSTVGATAGPDTVVFVADLARPGSAGEVDALVEREAAGEPEVLVEDFRASLHAAFRPDEVRDQLRTAGLDRWLDVEPFGDRHLLVAGRHP